MNAAVEQLSRRTFLAQATCVGSFAAFSFSARSVHGSSADQALRIAAIGVGNRGADNLIQLQHENVVALCDVDARYLHEAQRRFPDARLYRDYRKLLSDEELDAVLISTPDHSHALPALLAMRRGCHVYCEKPLAHNLNETRLLVTVAREQQVITQMANQHHASAGYRRARALLNKNVLGKVKAIHAWTLRPVWPQGVPRPQDQPSVPDYLDWDLWLGPAAERPYHPAYHPIAWRGWWDFGSGAIGDMGTHLLESVITGLGLYSPAEIVAESSKLNSETLPGWTIVRYRFPATADRDAIELTWYDGGKQPVREITGANRLPDDGVLVIGERGKLFLPKLGKAPRLVPPTLENDVEPLQEPATSEGHITQWLKACKQKQPEFCDTPFEVGATLTNLCLMGNLTVRVGRKIEWDADKGLPVNCPECLPFLGREYRDGWALP